MPENNNACEVCQRPAAQRCGGCYNTFYCGKEHQKGDWRRHKKTCQAIQICEDPIMGRCLVATRPLKSGEVILREPPLISGPSPSTVPVCLGCGKVIDETNSRPCLKCGWPVCGELCEKAPQHLPECTFTVQRGDKVSIKNFGVPHPIYQCITPLRCLYQKEFLPRVWRKLDLLQSHCEERKATAKYETERVFIAEFILRFFKLGHVFSEEDIMRVCGIIMVNSHEVPLTEPPHVAIYGTTSLLEHSCRANCSKSFTEEGSILLTAARDISKGERLSICYTDALWGTPNRRQFLHETKFFWCQCPRCGDPTELGTFFSALKCKKGACQGYLLPKSFTEGTKKPPDWTCSKCLDVSSAYSVHDILERVGRDLSELDKGKREECKSFLKTYGDYLHDNHFYLTDVRISLATSLGQDLENGLCDLADEDLVLKAKSCLHLSKLIQILAPAEKRTIGILMFELHASSAEIARRKGLENPEEMRFILTESRNALKEAVDLLKFEPEVLPEGKVCKQARLNLKQIDLTLDKLQKNAQASLLGSDPLTNIPTFI